MKANQNSHDGSKNHNPHNSSSNSNLYSDNDPSAIIITSSEQHLDELINYCLERNLEIIGKFVLPVAKLVITDTLPETGKIIIVADQINSFTHIYKDIIKFNSLLEENKLEIHLPLQNTLIKLGKDNEAMQQWKAIVSFTRQSSDLFASLGDIRRYNKNNELLNEVVRYIDELRKDEEDDAQNNSVIVTLSDVQVIKLRHYCLENGLRVINYFGTPNAETIYRLVDFVKERIKKITIVIDSLDSISRIYRDFAVLDQLITEDRVEIHLPLQKAVIRNGEVNDAVRQWNILALLAQSYSVVTPKVNLQPDSEKEVYDLSEEFMRQLSISSEQRHRIYTDISKSIEYMSEQDAIISAKLHKESMKLRDCLLQSIRDLNRGSITYEEYHYEREVLEKQLKDATDILPISLQNVTNFNDAVFETMDIVLNGSYAFTKATKDKKRRIINLMFSKLELVDGKLEFTLRPAFVEFFKNLPK